MKISRINQHKFPTIVFPIKSAIDLGKSSMATAAVAGAAGAAVVMYYTGWGIPWGIFKARSYNAMDEGISEEGEGDLFVGGIAQDVGKRRIVVPIIARAPSTWFESLSTISETLRFTYSETLGKWPIGDLAFGVNYLLRRQGNEHVAEAFINEDSQLINGPHILNELREYLRVLLMCMHFSKKPFPNFLEAIGFKGDQVLHEEGKAGILKPAFTVLLDHEHKCVLLLIRGTHSVKDTLTSLTGAVVPFHHTIFGKDGVSKLILGYAHCGMVAAARWIAVKATKRITESLREYPTYQLKIVGHSLGGGTAALLSYILQEQNVCTSLCCVCFGPAACMTRELAESGSEFVITIINECDLVPCFSSGSLDDLRAEVTASAWVNDFREQIERTRILRTMFRSASALRCRLQTIASISRASVPASSMMVSRAAQTGMAGVGAIWKPVSNGTRGIVKQAIAAVRRPSLMSWPFSKSSPPNIYVSAFGTQTLDILETSNDTKTSSSSPTLEQQETNNFIINSITTTQEEIDSLPSSSKQSFNLEKISNESSQEFLKDILSRGFDLSNIEIDDENMQELPQLLNETGDINESITQLEVQDELEQFDEPTSPNSGMEEIGEDLLWQQVAEELERQQNIAEVETQQVREEEAKVAKEIIKEEENVVSAVANEIGKEKAKSAVRIDSMKHFFPPGRIMHLVGPRPIKLENQAEDFEPQVQQIGLYLTKRNLYGKIRLSRTMVHDHYMPTYKRMIEAMIEQFETQILAKCDVDNIEILSCANNLKEVGTSGEL